MKKMFRVNIGIGNTITVNPKKYYIEEKNLKDFLLNTNFNEYNFLTFQVIEIWEPQI